MQSTEAPPPCDKVRLIVTDVAAGDIYRMSSATVPDKFIFRRSATVANGHELMMTAAEWEAAQEDLGLRPAGSNAHLKVYFIVDEAAHGGGEVIAALRAELAEAKKRHEAGIAALGKELDEVRGQAPEGVKGALNDEDTAYLRERDALIALLLPHVEDEENDTPVGVLSRLLARLETGNADAAAPPASVPRGTVPEPPAPAEFDRKAYLGSLPRDLGELRGLASPAGIPGAANMNQAQLRNALLRYELARRAPHSV